MSLESQLFSNSFSNSKKLYHIMHIWVLERGVQRGGDLFLWHLVSGSIHSLVPAAWKRLARFTSPGTGKAVQCLTPSGKSRSYLRSAELILSMPSIPSRGPTLGRFYTDFPPLSGWVGHKTDLLFFRSIRNSFFWPINVAERSYDPPSTFFILYESTFGGCGGVVWPTVSHYFSFYTIF
jgi:hypothetical protein